MPIYIHCTLYSVYRPVRGIVAKPIPILHSQSSVVTPHPVPIFRCMVTACMRMFHLRKDLTTAIILNLIFNLIFNLISPSLFSSLAIFSSSLLFFSSSLVILIAIYLGYYSRFPRSLVLLSTVYANRQRPTRLATYYPTAVVPKPRDSTLPW